MLSLETILTMVIMLVVLILAGNAMSGAIDDSMEDSQDITICDWDNSDFSKAVLKQLEEQTKETDGEVTYVDIQSEDYASELKRLDIKSVVIIPKGFSDQVESGKAADVIFVQRMTSLSTLSNLNTGSETALSLIEASVKSTIYAQKISAGVMTTDEMIQIEAPVNLQESTVVDDKCEDISSSMVMSLCSTQNMILPIILFILIMYSSQMILSAITTEKIDKTLETLLSAPVSRISVISAKMLAAGVVAALQAVVYIIGMNKMMGGLYDNIGDTSQYSEAIENLGLSMSASQYLLAGIQMFLSILISLSISLILGALAKDAKSANTLLLPITLSAMIPYLLSMILDIKTVSPILRYIVYAIPFTHTFMASENIMFHDFSTYIGGLIYQIIFLIICIIIALRIFMSDKIFTVSLSLSSKKSKKSK